MIEPGERVLDSVYVRCVRSRRPAQHDHLNAECTRRGDLAISRGTATVLGYDDFDLVLCHQRAVIRFAERPARSDVGDMRKPQRRVHRIDAADQITVLRRACKGREFVAADGDEYVAVFLSDSVNRHVDVVDLDPSVARNCAPGRPPQSHKCHEGFARRRDGILRDNMCVRMRGVDQRVDALRGEIGGQPLGAAKAADADRYRVRNRRSRAAGERQRHVKAGAASKPCRQLPRFRRAAEDEDFCHAGS
jgi:hypothetical protein